MMSTSASPFPAAVAFLRRLAVFAAVFISSPATSFGVRSANAAKTSNTWAVIVDTSRYFYNYRHAANALSFYHTVKRLGVPDSQILLFLAEDYACSARNSFPGQIFNDQEKQLNLYTTARTTVLKEAASGTRSGRKSSKTITISRGVEVDYRGDEVTVLNFLRLLTGKHFAWTPRNKRLLTDENSNILIYATGHSGAGFLKFQDWEELQSQDLADAIHVMHRQRRYKKIFWISDTCQAATLQNDITAPNVLALGSSKVGENSYSHHVDHEIGAAVIDRFTHDSLEFFEQKLVSGGGGAGGGTTTAARRPVTVADYVNSLSPYRMMSNAELRTDLMVRERDKDPGKVKLLDFFGSSGGVAVERIVVEGGLISKNFHEVEAGGAGAGADETGDRVREAGKEAKAKLPRVLREKSKSSMDDEAEKLQLEEVDQVWSKGQVTLTEREKLNQLSEGITDVLRQLEKETAGWTEDSSPQEAPPEQDGGSIEFEASFPAVAIAILVGSLMVDWRRAELKSRLSKCSSSQKPIEKSVMIVEEAG